MGTVCEDGRSFDIHLYFNCMHFSVLFYVFRLYVTHSFTNLLKAMRLLLVNGAKVSSNRRE